MLSSGDEFLLCQIPMPAPHSRQDPPRVEGDELRPTNANPTRHRGLTFILILFLSFLKSSFVVGGCRREKKGEG